MHITYLSSETEKKVLFSFSDSLFYYNQIVYCCSIQENVNNAIHAVGAAAAVAIVVCKCCVVCLLYLLELVSLEAGKLFGWLFSRFGPTRFNSSLKMCYIV